MIGSIDIKVNAARPNLPLCPLFAFQDSPSSLRVMDVPKSIGNWAITSVKVAIEYPDNTTVEKTAVRNGSVWVATFEGSEVAGKVLNGYSVLADGIDEDGNDVTGYVLGKGDVFILENDTELSRLVGKIAVRYVDDIPDVPTKGDLMNSNGELRLFDGEDWLVISTTEPPPVYDAQITIQKNGTPVGTFTVNANEPKTIDIPVPSNTSDIVNDSGFITVEAIPSDISSFNNDVGYITESAIPSNVGAFQNDVGYLTSVSWGGVQDKPDVALMSDIPSNVSELENDAGYITANALPTKTSDLVNDSGFITLAQVPTPSYIEDANGRKIEADLDCIAQDLTLPWTLVDGQDTYTLNYDEQTSKWRYEEAETKKIELSYGAQYSIWELDFYLWNNDEWHFDTGSTTTQEKEATSLTILGWTLTRSILKSDKLAKESDLPTKTSDLVNDSGFITASAIPSNVSAFNNDVGYLTASSSALAEKRDYNDLTYPGTVYPSGTHGIRQFDLNIEGGYNPSRYTLNKFSTNVPNYGSMWANDEEYWNFAVATSNGEDFTFNKYG